MNKEEITPADSYNIRGLIKDITNILGKQNDSFLDFEKGLEAADPAAQGRFRKEGSPTHWQGQLDRAGTPPQEFPFFVGLLITYNYFFTRKRINETQAQINEVIKTLSNITTRLESIQRQQTTLAGDIKNVQDNITKMDADLSTKMTKNVQIINQNTDNDANKVIKALP